MIKWSIKINVNNNLNLEGVSHISNLFSDKLNHNKMYDIF
jgi:hypothetical protein